MALIIDESFEYRHKKFDQGKRAREETNTSSSSSSSVNNEEYIEVDVESVDDQAYNPFCYNYKEQQSSATSPPAPPGKRRRTSSFGSSVAYSAFTPLPVQTLGRNTSTPLVALATSPILAPTAAILPKISDETLRSICKYHGNMVRKFPKKERTPKDQERRDRNTIACRMSRRVKKLEHVAIEEQYKEFSQQTFAIIEQAMRSTAYLHELMKLSNEVNDAQQTQEMHTKCFALEEERPASASSEKKSFSIAYLMGSEE